MDPVQAGFCLEFPKSFPSSHSFPWAHLGSAAVAPSPSTHFRPQARIAAFFPVLFVLRDVFQRQKQALLPKVIQVKSPIKTFAMNLSEYLDRGALTTQNIIHPARSPLSRARLAYLNCIPPHEVKASTLEYAQTWERLFVKCPEKSLRNFSKEDLREEFNWYLEVASRGAIFPHHSSVLPKIEAAADMIFSSEYLKKNHVGFAFELLDLLRHSKTSFDALYVTSRILSLPYHKYESEKGIKRNLPYHNDIHQILNTIGQRLAHMCVVFGHPEMTMMQAQKFSKLTRSYKIPNDRYHFYREDLLELLKPMADTYPDTRIYSTMCSIELLRGGNRTKALRYALQGLERPTRPRGYELALIQAGRMLPDGDDALNAFQLAFQLLTQPFLLPGQSDRFPFATKRRLAYRLQALDNLAEALWFRAVHVVGGEGSRRFLQFRTEVLEARHSLKPECIKAGLINKNGEAIYKSAMTLDEMLFELLDPEVVLEEERNTAYHGGSLTLLHQKGHTSGLQSLLQAFDTAGQTQTSVRSLQVDTMEQTDELNMGSISEEDYEEIAQSPPPTHTPDLHSVEQFQTTVRSLDVD